LRIGSAAPYVEGLIPAVIARLTERYPQIKFRITDTDAVTPCGMLRERKLDLVVGRVLSSIFGEDLISEFLFDDCMHVVAGTKKPVVAAPQNRACGTLRRTVADAGIRQHRDVPDLRRLSVRRLDAPCAAGSLQFGYAPRPAR
jgi:DNA-binding transcriptional LysR family regulator